MTSPIQLTPTVSVSGQIEPGDLVGLQAAGVRLVVNNRPDGEEAGQPPSERLAEAARQLSLRYLHLPVDHRGFQPDQVHALAAELADVESNGDGGSVLLFCRTGTRSTLLWALAEATRGTPIDRIARAADDAGYSVQPIRRTLDLLAARERE